MLLQRLTRSSPLLSRKPAPYKWQPGRPNLAAASQPRPCSTTTCFTGTTAGELREWLERGGVDATQYGEGLSKHIEDLFDEVSKKESVLDIEAGCALRIVNVLSLHVANDAGQILYEEEQILPDGRSRRRNVPVSEKMIGNEPWQDALQRAVAEELGTVLPKGYQVLVTNDKPQQRTEYNRSMSYPGLLTKYNFHRVHARVPGLPNGPFTTAEPRPNGQLVTRWVWRDPPLREAF